MALTLGSNIASLRGQRQLSKTSAELVTVFERLSSGQRINRASDDAAGLAIAESLSANSRVQIQSVRNLGDGLSLLSLADSSIESLSGIVMRLEELATQAANGVYTTKQRKALDAEAQALSKEFFRISKVTEFNGQRLFTGELQSVNLQAGVGNNAVLSSGIGGAIGTGSFGASVSYTTESTLSTSVSLGDLNGDGILDMVTAGSGGGGYATVRLGTGNGAFGAAASYQTENTQSNAVALGDLNGDGILDLVTAGYGADGRATVRLGTGSGTFGSATSYTTEGGGSNGLSLGDLNGDGFLDLVTAGQIGGGSVGYITVRLGSGNGTFGTAVSYSNGGLNCYAVTLADVDADGILDMLTTDYSAAGSVTVRRGTGNGTFGAGTVYTDTFKTDAIAVADLNNDGFLDLVTGGTNSVWATAIVRLGAGNGTFGAATTYLDTVVGAENQAVSLGDLNGDGILDLVTAGVSSGGRATVRLGNGNGTFGAAISYATESVRSWGLSLGDLNGDGVLDIATAGNSGAGRATTLTSNTQNGISPLLPFSLKTLADARQAIPVFKRKREQLAEQRGGIGAFQSRIEVAVNVLQASSENFKAAESRIRDADIADESSRLVRINILQQAAAAVLAQANQQPALVLALLK